MSAGASPAGPRRPLRIGITGPIGCGKSTVAAWLGELGGRVIDADLIARDVTPPGSQTLEAVVRAFGDGILRDDGSLDRAALGRVVFNDPVALARLEAIIHPAVRPRILDAIADAERERPPAIVIEAIKLVEGGLATLCDEVWLVTCDRASQLARLAGRGMDPADAEARIATQSGLAERLSSSATRVIDTTGAFDATRLAVQSAWTEATERAGR